MRGLTDTVKRKAIFEFYRNTSEIILLQETHSTPEVEQKWITEWGGRIIFSHGQSNARGVCILFKKDFFCNKNNISRDFEGRVICCELEWPETEHVISLCNIYAPNHDAPSFYDALSQRLADYTENKIILGDYNLVMDTKMDRASSNYNHTKARNMLQQMIDEYILSDVWRDRNPTKLGYSWFHKNQGSRIDFCLASRGMDHNIDHIQYTASTMSDHAALFTTINMHQTKRGPGYWKMNTQLLQSPENKEIIKQKLEHDISTCAINEPKALWQHIKKRAKLHLQNLARRETDEK